jgi:hypothetical protein
VGALPGFGARPLAHGENLHARQFQAQELPQELPREL